MHKMNIAFFTIIYFILLFNNTKQANILHIITSLKAIDKTINKPWIKAFDTAVKNPMFARICNNVKNPMKMIRRQQNNIKDFTFNLQKKREKYWKTKLSVGTKSVDYFVVEGIQKFELPKVVREGTRLVRKKGTEKVQMMSDLYSERKRLNSVVYRQFLSKPYRILVVGEGLRRQAMEYKKPGQKKLIINTNNYLNF